MDDPAAVQEKFAPSIRTRPIRSTCSASIGSTTPAARASLTCRHCRTAGELTGVKARIVLALGNRFPMIRAHKVLAAYGCLVPRLVTGQFDPTRHRAVWPSTGNYCRGGVAISRILGCRGVAVLPENMSRSASTGSTNGSPIRPTSSARRARRATSRKSTTPAPRSTAIRPTSSSTSSASSAITSSTASAPARRWNAVQRSRQRPRQARLAAFVSASGSAGTLAAGDHLKQKLGARIVAVEAAECPTLLYNGFGEHNIQGIGDKHVP